MGDLLPVKSRNSVVHVADDDGCCGDLLPLVPESLASWQASRTFARSTLAVVFASLAGDGGGDVGGDGDELPARPEL